MLKKIISGGQTGADQAALDVAIQLGIPHGGWIPKGRITEKGTLPDKYLLREMPDSSYARRTEQNVIDSDGTLIISHGSLTGGSELTLKFAQKHNRPWLHLNLNRMLAVRAAHQMNIWLKKHDIQVLNVAGPRASHDPLIYEATANIIQKAVSMDQKRFNDRAKGFGQQPAKN